MSIPRPKQHYIITTIFMPMHQILNLTITTVTAYLQWHSNKLLASYTCVLITLVQPILGSLVKHF